ncbi:hypothetical protein HRbin17_02519 [bacterium HR17]|jgi:Skp family chaperone for outer membrane proteins|uniref:Chaperone protein Skp n=1 Tax=Candidatus Fervidibacter japonicus TaxID=2035412 RepID=A0A2H5XFN4_9BACT|nr:hypothetical protein HRbin17_02519 [bacterium HR17]
MRWVIVGLAVTVLALLCRPWQVSGSVQGWQVGVIDSARIGREGQFTDLRRTYDEQRRAYLELINLRQNYLMLTGLEWADLRRLVSKPQRSRQEDERLQQLRRLELEREAELQRLQQTPPAQMSPADRARLEELTRLWKEGREDLTRLRELMEEELRRVEAELNKAVDEKVRAAIQAIAAQQGLDFVLDKSALYFVRGQVVDITDAVLKTLNTPESAAPTSPQGKKADK